MKISSQLANNFDYSSTEKSISPQRHGIDGEEDLTTKVTKFTKGEIIHRGGAEYAEMGVFTTKVTKDENFTAETGSTESYHF